MKFLLTSLFLASGANAFAPSSSIMKSQFSLQMSKLSWEDNSDHPNGEWQYRPWSGITQEDFYPMSQAGNAMVSASEAGAGSSKWSWEDATEHPNGEWQYRPWSGITKENFYPESHAGNTMFFFPSPAATVGGAAVTEEAAALPPAEQVMPEQEQVMPAPEMPANV